MVSSGLYGFGMFTGIIQQIGVVSRQNITKHGGRLEITPTSSFKKPQLGESMAVDGCCLTLVSVKNKKTYVFDVSGETVKRTTMQSYRVGRKVNLERALHVGDALGGHFVSGHVDGMGVIHKIRRLPSSCLIEIKFPSKWRPYFIEKGSVAVDGISLTVCDLTRHTFSVAIIPHTETVTTLSFKKEGDVVNLEVDMLAKYVEGLLRFRSWSKR